MTLSLQTRLFGCADCTTDDLTLNDVLQASEIRVMGGSLDVCYDARGTQYNVPRYVYSDPTNVVDDTSFLDAKFKQHSGPVTPLTIKLKLSSSVSMMSHCSLLLTQP